MSNTHMYVVIQRTLRYNDEYYFMEGGTPSKLFSTQEKAEDYCRALNAATKNSYNSPEDFGCESWDELPDFFEVFMLKVDPVG